MKHRVKRLTLNRETVTTLAVGGIETTTSPIYNSIIRACATDNANTTCQSGNTTVTNDTVCSFASVCPV